MPYRTNIVYLYDGSFQGLLCCVYESYRQREIPEMIFSPDTLEMTLYPIKEIETSSDTYRLVERTIKDKLSGKVLSLVLYAFLTGVPQKEMMILSFLRSAFRFGKQIIFMRQLPQVDVLQKAVTYLRNEAHLLSGFIRFSDYGKYMGAVIEPKNMVLPLLLPHFSNRFPDMTFFIYDQTHGMVLVHHPEEKSQILSVDMLALPPVSMEEIKYRNLWKRFYDTIAIEGRYNPTCRMTHCPKRYWKHMTELSDLLTIHHDG